MRNAPRLAILVLAAVIVGQALIRRSPRPTTSGPGAPAPELVLRSLDGSPYDLSARRGRVVAVNFWATWCAPCREEMPELAEAWRRGRGRCFEVVGVAEESARDDVEQVARSIPYPIVVDERAAAAAAWKIRGYPATFVVDADGKVRHTFEGAVQRGELEDAVRPLLPASCPEG